jgi:HAE1 family hydrophobic/amphiphilic exporter-1
MKLVEHSVRYPVTTTVGVILLALFGGIALLRIPIQLTPTVEEPQVTVTTFWPGASPQEVEREVVDQQEEHLKSLEGLRKLESSSADSQGTLTLTFEVGSENDANLLRVANRLDQVPRYPDDADKPILTTVGNQFPIAWFVLTAGGEQPFAGDIDTLFNFVEDFIKPEFERVSGVARADIFAGREQEMQVIVDPAELAARGVTINQLAAGLERENRNWSGGDFSEGKRRYVVRTVGDYRSPQEIEDVVVAVKDGVPIFVGDVAHAELGYRKPTAQGYSFGTKMIAMSTTKRPGANVLTVMEELKAAAQQVNRELLAPRGLVLTQAYDETEYIGRALKLVRGSLLLGAALAVVVLLLFLRSATSTLIISTAIPICAVGTFLTMSWSGRTLNVVSLAGMAFAVGMVVDNSIVVLENIYRHMQMGKDRRRAALDGAQEVWGAVLASTLTTIAVFVPVVFIQQEAGQLFRDIAIAISCGVGLSLIVAVTVIPSMSAKLLRTARGGPAGGEGAAAAGESTDAARSDRSAGNLWGGIELAGRWRRRVEASVSWINRTTARRLAVVVGMTAASVGLSVALSPKAEYLPVGNSNFLFGIVLPPPGYNIEETASLRSLYEQELSYLWTTPPEAAKDLPGGGSKGFFYVALPQTAFFGVRAGDPLRVRELIPPFQQVSHKIPGAIAFVTQFSIFQTGFGSGRSIDIQLTGPELTRLVELGGEVFGRVMQVLPGAQARPIPSLDLGNPEVQVHPHRRRAAEMGISNRDLGFVVSALIDGAKASEYRYQGDELDLKVVSTHAQEHRTHLLEQMPIATADGRLVTLGSVAEVREENGPVEIAHRERQRAITIQVTPADEMPLQAAMETIEREILDPMRQAGRLGGLYRVSLAGSADKLTQTGQALYWNFLLAVVITYLLMAALFESFLHPLVIIFSVPLGAVGGFLGLAVLNLFTYQALDVLTMLGFIILVGTVVNNAILIVHQSLNHMRFDGMAPEAAIREATGNRIRPIFMSVLTSVFGMLPLVIFPGAGSELYRGLGSVVVGGLVVSTLFTLFLVPALFSLALDARAAAGRWLGRRTASAAQAAGVK